MKGVGREERREREKDLLVMLSIAFTFMMTGNMLDIAMYSIPPAAIASSHGTASSALVPIATPTMHPFMKKKSSQSALSME
jgi:hypothetical protein